MQYLSFCDWFISLSIMTSRFFHVVIYCRIFSFLGLNNIPLYVQTTFFFIHSSVDGHLDSFHILALMNNAEMNIGALISLQDPDFSSLDHTQKCDFWIIG